MECTIKLDVVGVHLLCLGLTRSFNKNNLKNIPLHVKALYCVKYTRLHPEYNVSRAVIKVTRTSFFFGGGDHPTLKLSGILTFTFIVSLTHRMDNI